VDLSTCHASVGALLFSVTTQHDSKTGTSLTDTIIAAYPYYTVLTLDSLAVANGWTLPATKVRAVLPNSAFGSGGEYRVGGLVNPYVQFGTADFDSATVSWTVSPVATLAAPPARGDRAGPELLPNGALLPPKR
jgi:hypothetical protein